MANSEYPDEMLHKIAFHQGLHCLPRQMDLQRMKRNFALESITCAFSVCSFMKNPVGVKRIH